jgi:DNA-binding SARP family transcriptional activator/ABC-type transport system substrate-binding protein
MRHRTSVTPSVRKEVGKRSERWFTTSVEFAVLGPVEARVDGQKLPTGGPKQRAVLAILLLHGNRPVSRDRLIEGLWGESPPPSAAHTLDDYVSRLRRALGADRIERHPAGYLIRVEPGELDLKRFEALLERGRSTAAGGDATTASAVLGEALDLWRGRPLADLEYAPFAPVEAQRLEERRLLALEARIDAELELGQASELVGELEGLVSDHPFRERLLGQLMLALYRAGRQASALEAFRAARRRFASELGIEPGPQLAQLEQQILEHDPSLSVEGGIRRPSARRRRVWLLATAAVGVAAIAAGVAAFAPSTRPAGVNLRGSQVARLVRLEARSGTAHAAPDLPGTPASIAVTNGSLWIADTVHNELLRADSSTGAIADRIPLKQQPGDVAAGAGAVWVASTGGPSVTRVDATTDAILQVIRLDGIPSALAFVDRALWIGDPTDQELLRIDPASGDVKRVTVGVQPSAVVAGGGMLWVAGYDSGSVLEIDPRSGLLVATMHVGQGPAALVFSNGSLWVANRLDGTVSRVDPTSGSTVRLFPTGSAPTALAVANGSVWVANTFSGTVSRIDTKRGAVFTIPVGGDPTVLAPATAAGRSSVWVGAGPRDMHRGGTLVLLDTRRFGSIDPQIENEAPPAEFLGLVNDGLVAYDHTAGPDGLRLVPDLALAIPEAADGSRTFTFRLRPRIRYSTGRLVRASDFVRGMQRLFRAHSPGAAFFDRLVGARSCAMHPARCRLSSGVIADDRTRTLTFRLTAPDPDFLFKLALGFIVPVPPWTPMHDIGTHPIPGTGPYRFASIGAHRIVFVRNPRFHEWSHAAQPDGQPDRIEWRFGATPAQEDAAVERGRADWTGDLSSDLGSVVRRYAPQVHSNVFPTLFWVEINSHNPPFNDIRVRRALNDAVDRAAVARAYGGSLANAPSCQTIPPGLPGYAPYCPYTLDRGAGRWTAPDLPRAHRLVAASRTRGSRVTIWDISDTGHAEPVVPYLVRVLRELGYRPHVRVLSSQQADRASVAVRATVDLMPVAFGPDYPSAAEAYSLFLACGGAYNWRWFCDRKLDAEAQQAEAVRLTNPKRSAALWARLDGQLVNRAVWVPLTSQRIIDIVSRRLHNYDFSPIYHFLPAQASFR